MKLPYLSVLLVILTTSGAPAQESFVNWETPHVHPLEMTPDGSVLLAVNTADNRLEVFDILEVGGLDHRISIPVGLDPVSVRVRSDSEAWVVNHISDSVSIVDLDLGTVVATLSTGDEPADVVFAGDPVRAFVSCSQVNTIQVFDPDDLSASPDEVELFAEDPRAMAVSNDGLTVYVAVFESGNASTVLGGIGVAGSTDPDAFPPDVVSHDDGPYGGENPPPNSGDVFDPAQNTDNPDAPTTSLIVKKNADGDWIDGNGEDWTDMVSGANADLSGRLEGWDLPDYDLAAIDTATLELSYASGLMNICMALAVNPVEGSISVIGTDATNEIRFEPNLEGTFLRVLLATIEEDDLGSADIVDLNPHLDYLVSSIDQEDRDQSLGDPRAMVWNSVGDTAYVCGKGSNNVIIIDTSGQRSGTVNTVEVGEGPTGLAIDEDNDRLYVLNHFGASISVVDTETEEELEQLPFFDPTPEAIRVGRKHLYDTHETSGLGHIACASCHIDSRMDRLGWDLGDPAGEMKEFNQNCLDDALGGDCDDYHPMKGVMLTQTLQDIIGHEPFHWRGDRDGIEEFNGAFMSLQGDDEELTDDEMQEFEDFLDSIYFPPNPFRSLDNSLPEDLPLPGHYTTGRFDDPGDPLPNGDAVQGLLDYRTANLDGVECVTCHTLDTGMGRDTELVGFSLEDFPVGPNGEHHLGVTSLDVTNGTVIKVPHLRNIYERTGFNTTQLENTAGFGYLHDGSVDSIERFVGEPVFSFSSDQEIADQVAFMLAFSGGDLPEGSNVFPFDEPVGPEGQHTHAAVGLQLTFDGSNNDDADDLDRFELMRDLAEDEEVGLVAKGIVADEARGYYFAGGGDFQSDRLDETIDWESLLDEATVDSVLTFTVVPEGSEERIGVDRDEDGFFDRDELDECSDPADPDDVPDSGCDDTEFDRRDCNLDDGYDIADPISILAVLFLDDGDFACDDACDSNDDGTLSVADAIYLLAALFQGGEAPAAPYDECGTDPTRDALGCDAYDACL